MFRHASLNKAFRTIWNKSRQCFMAVAECVRAKSGGVSNPVLQAVAAAIMLLGPADNLRADNTDYVIGPTGATSGSYTYGDELMFAYGDTLTVEEGGSVSGSPSGVTMSGITTGIITGTTWSILNSGTIEGQDVGIRSLGSQLSGGLINNGSISGGNPGMGGAGIALFGSSLAGGISNTGWIYGFSYALDITASTVNGVISNSGLIQAATWSGIGIWNSQIDAIDNSGTIRSGVSGHPTEHAPGIGLYSGALVTGSIVNSGLIDGEYGLEIRGWTGAGSSPPVTANSIAGSIINSGTIFGNYSGIYLGLSTVNGNVENTGLIQGQISGIKIDNSLIAGDIVNSGVLIGLDDNGLLIDSSTYIGGVFNAGTILGSISGINISDSLVSGDITNSGFLRAGRTALWVESANIHGAIVNTGTMIATDVYSGIYLNQSQVGGSIVNHGLIQGNSGGLVADDGSFVLGGLQNTGTIRGLGLGAGIDGVYAYGIGLKDNSTISGGLTNSGYIEGAVAAIFVDTGSELSDGITNSGVIAGMNGLAIENQNIISALEVLNTVSGAQVGTIFGAIDGYANVTNAGLWALQRLEGGTIAAGTSVASSISGNYSQLAGGTLQIGVNGTSGSGTLAGNYSTLAIGGTASLDTGSTISVMMSADHSVLAGGTLSSVIAAAGGLTAGTLGITDNSTLVDFNYIAGSNNLDLVAYAHSTGCGPTASGNITGPCEVGFDSPDLYVDSSGSISGGNQGIKVLAGSINGRILNEGYIGGNLTGVQFLAGSSLSGGITNSGSIVGTNAGISVAGGAWVAGGITNNSGGYISSINNAGQIGGTDLNIGVHIISSTISGGISNTGVILGNVSAVVLSASFLAGGVSNQGRMANLGDSDDAEVFLIKNSTIIGDIVNTGTVSTPAEDGHHAVYMLSSDLSGEISNAGYIYSWYDALRVEYSTITGDIVNTGTVRGYTFGLVVSETQLNGAIRNSGLIEHYDYAEGPNAAVGVLSGADITNGITNSGVILGYGTAILIDDSSNLTGGISNTGLIAGASGVAILNENESNILEVLNTIGSGDDEDQVGTIVGAINGYANVSNSGLWALHAYGSLGGLVHSSISGNYTQESEGTLRIIAMGDEPSEYSTLTVGGVASFAGPASLDLRFASGSTLTAGNTLTGVVSATAINNLGTFNVSDNSALLDYIAENTGTQINLAGTESGACVGSVSSGTTVPGPCLVAFDAPNLIVESTGTITGTDTGIKVLAGDINGGITNQGYVTGSAVGLLVSQSANLLGNIQNTGIIFSDDGVGIKLTQGTILGGITNSGSISSLDRSGVLIAASSLGGSVENSGQIQSNVTAIRIASSFISGGINNSGSIVGSYQGIFLGEVSHLENGVTNSGLIEGSARGLWLGWTTVSGSLLNTGTIQSIDSGGVGLDVWGLVDGSISNSGALNGGVGLRIGNSYTSDSFGVMSSISGSIYNTNLISGSYTGLLIESASLIVEGVTNMGRIQGHSIAGIEVAWGSTVNGIVNEVSGTISGVQTGLKIGNYYSSGGSIEWGQGAITTGIINSGLIAGTTAGIAVAYGSTIFGAVDNTGSIIGAVGVNVALGSAVLGGIINNLGGYISSINNAGQIGGTAPLTGWLFNAASMSGGLTNSGTIQGANLAIAFNGSSYVHGGLANSAAGLIRGGYRGLSVSNSAVMGGLTNAGLIEGEVERGISLESASLDGLIINLTGSIVGGGDAIGLGNSTITGTLNNAGYIEGLTNSGVALYASEVSSGLNNDNGQIFGAQVGLMVGTGSRIDGGLTNVGTISGQSNTGIRLLGSTVAGGLNNVLSGYIIGGTRGISLVNSTMDGGITNAGRILGDATAIVVESNALLTGGIRNTGFIEGTTGLAVTNLNSSNTIEVVNTVSGSQVGTVVGAINGYANVTNAGLWAFQQMSGGVIVDGSPVTSSISGNYTQLAGGTLQIGVDGSSGTGTLSGNYSTLGIGGAAVFDTNAAIKVSMNADHAVLAGGTLIGVVTADGGIISDGFNITDNSALVDFRYATIGGALDLIAYASSTGCNTVSGVITGPCSMAFDAPDAYIASTGSISGANTGIKVLSGAINGRILNEGYIGGNLTGVQFLAGSSLSGGITNSGSIVGTNAGIHVASGAAVLGGIINTAGGYISSINNAGQIGQADIAAGLLIQGGSLSGGITNSGTIMGQYGGLLALSGSKINGGVVNTGLLLGGLGGYGGLMAFGSEVDGGINNTGSIIGLGDYLSGILAGGAINLTYSVINGGITNSGLISGAIRSGVHMSGATLDGDLINQIGGTINGAEGGLSISGLRSFFSIPTTINGSISNAGFIAGNAGAGIRIASDVYVTGSIFNNEDGKISGVTGINLGNNVSIGAGLLNLGIIDAVQIGVQIDSGATVSGITNAGLIASDSGIAIQNLSANPMYIANSSLGTKTGTIVGAINGYVDVVNSGLWALQRMEGGTIAAGTSIASLIGGNYSQLAGGTLRIGVNGTSGSGTLAGNFSTLAIDGTASLDTGSTISVMMSADHSVLAGGTLTSVITAAAGLTAGILDIRDNSTLVNFVSIAGGNNLDLVAYEHNTGCGPTASGNITGPCEVGFDAPDLYVHRWKPDRGSISSRFQLKRWHY
jgi:Extended Signal Peptide of Type V secretion system